MKKRAFLFLAALFVLFTANAANYYVSHGASVSISHSTHYPKAVNIVGTESPVQLLDNIATAPGCAAYFDKTTTVFEVRAGETVTPNISINGDWMHGYVYVDWDNSGEFDVDVTGTGPYTKGANNELMCWSLYGHNSDGDTGYNSDGVYQSSGNVLAPGSFTVPAGLTEGSTFRMRYKVEWNSIDPAGTAGSKFLTDGGSIIDVTLKIVASSGNVDTDGLYPIDDYTEPRVGTTPNESAWSTIDDGLNATWASRDVHYKLHEVPEVVKKSEATIYAWQGERANIQALLYSKTDQGNLSVRMTTWKKGETTTSINAGEARFVNYVITDDYKQCGDHPINLTPWLVADVIDQDKPHAVPAMETRPVWCKIEVPRNIEAGVYTTTLEVVNESDQVVETLNLNINVNSRSIPEVKDQKFHLDFWQQPYAVSRYYQVDRWSDAHIEALRPYLKALGDAGQRTVSAILFYEPWGVQSHDKFDPMIQTTLKSDGTWSYDYTIFDKYVNLCAEYGIDKQINCFSMVPWDMSFRYWDEASSSYQTITTTTGATTYQNLWNSFLSSFKTHLQSKGWFEKTNIAMDERAEADMLNAYNIASNLGFKMALAGNYHSSLSDKLQDFCVALGQDKDFTEAQREYRKANNMVTTVYTSCADVEPNIYSNSLPAEATFLPIYAAANDLSGYLHWSWMNWAESPLKDTRFRLFGAGDTYCYYPGNRSSVRFERLVEGIHQYEKIQILKAEYANNSEKLGALNDLLARFVSHSISGEQCASYVNDLEDFLNGLEVEIPEPTDVTTGYYHMVSRATARTEHIYNDAFLSGNTKKFTLQSDSKVTTNNGIWRVTVNGDKLGIKNGDGNNLVAGASYYGNVVGDFSELTVGSTYDVGEYRYYFFSEALNCTNGDVNFKVNNIDYVTTWTDGPATAEDQQWRFEPVDMEGKSAFNVVINGAASGSYVTYTHGSTIEKAFNGGFFIAPENVSETAFAVVVPDEIVLGANIQVANGTITVSNIVLMEEPEKIELFNTSRGSMSIPPYRIPGIAKTSTGRLIAVAGRLVCGTDPGYGQVDAVCKISDDNGVTWSAEKDIAVGTGQTSATYNYFDTAFGDPAIVADRTSEEVAVIVVAGCTVYANTNTTRSNPNKIGIIHSTDNGNSWGTPVDITEQIYSLFDSGNPIESAFVAGGKVFQSRIVKKGQYYRLYAAMCARPNGNRVIYSDDFGRTWKALGGASALPATGGDEPKCEETPDGRVILSSRVAGGRIYNIYTYTNTMEATGSWSTEMKSTFTGSGKTPGNNSTNGEILVVPVKRNSDNKEMYLALQSLPTGSSRTNVGIFYKELSEYSDYNSVANLTIGWDGYYEVSTTESAYSSMDLQADNKIAFIYEETLTKHGTAQNPVSTSFPTGAGTHNYDGFDNFYIGYNLEYITNGAYSVKTDVNRGNIVKKYLTSYVTNAEAADELKAEANEAVQALGDNPTTAEIDNIYTLLQPRDPFDGKVVTFTNVQQNGTEYTIYVNSSNKLALSSSTVATLGESAQFECTKQENGKYSFRNVATNMYMIWRAGDSQSYGYNSNSGTLSTYNATYCDFSIVDGSSTKAGTYYMVGKRDGGSTEGTFVAMSATGVFDSWGNSVAWSSTYSNLYKIGFIESAPATYTIAVSTENSSYGTVAIQGYTETSAEIEEGTSVTVVATPAEGYQFDGWYSNETEVSTSASYTFTVSAETSLQARFEEIPAPEEPEYCTSFGNSTRTAGDRKLTSFTLSDGANGGTVNVNQSSSSGAAIYFDKTDTEISLEAGKEITSTIDWSSTWMHSYLYIDFNDDKEFTPVVENHAVTEDSELLAYSFWTGTDGAPTTTGANDSYGYNSLGQSVSGDARASFALPTFTIPTTVAEGTYRARFKIDWNTANACTINSTSEAPCVVDFMLTVTYPDGIADASADVIKVYANDGVIYINGYEGNVKVMNVIGQLVNDVYVNGNAQLDIKAGAYVVVTGDKVTKVIVK